MCAIVAIVYELFNNIAYSTQLLLSQTLINSNHQLYYSEEISFFFHS